jgi:hypothetical protein
MIVLDLIYTLGFLAFGMYVIVSLYTSSLVSTLTRLETVRNNAFTQVSAHKTRPCRSHQHTVQS